MIRFVQHKIIKRNLFIIQITCTFKKKKKNIMYDGGGGWLNKNTPYSVNKDRGFQNLRDDVRKPFISRQLVYK